LGPQTATLRLSETAEISSCNFCISTVVRQANFVANTSLQISQST
jgi:hypothetical protein